jgi:peptidoglycan/xylan/chitin deacetylase (PgdA/CDA1 family)
VPTSSGRRWRSTLKTALAATSTRAHDTGLTAPLARGGNRPLILGYHRVVEDYAAAARTEMPSMLIDRAMFERHLDCIGRRFRFVGLDEIGERASRGEPFAEPVAAVTFDDGYRDVYEQAYPVLRRKGIPAAVFVVTDLIGRPFWQVHDRLYHLMARAFSAWRTPQRELAGLLTGLSLAEDDITRACRAARSPLRAVSALLPALARADVHRLIRDMEASVGDGSRDVPLTLDWPELVEMRRAGFTIGSHTRSHVSLPMESDEVVADELETSRRQLEQRLGTRVTHLAYPGGQFTARVVEAAARAGYRFAYTACPHGDPRYPLLTQERLLLWQGASVDGDGRFSDAILSCQAHDLWPPSRQCARLHQGDEERVHG